ATTKIGASAGCSPQEARKHTASVAANATIFATMAPCRTAPSTPYGRYSQQRIAGPAIRPSVRKLLQAKASRPRPQRPARGTGARFPELSKRIHRPCRAAPDPRSGSWRESINRTKIPLDGSLVAVAALAVSRFLRSPPSARCFALGALGAGRREVRRRRPRDARTARFHHASHQRRGFPGQATTGVLGDRGLPGALGQRRSGRALRTDTVRRRDPAGDTSHRSPAFRQAPGRHGGDRPGLLRRILCRQSRPDPGPRPGFLRLPDAAVFPE